MYRITIPAEEIDGMPLVSFPGSITVIEETGAAFDKAVAYLRRQKVIGFDTESRPSFSADQPHYGVSLLQLSGATKAYLFRIKKCGMPASLCRLLSDDSIVKVGAAVHDDLRGLKRLHGFEPGAFVDLQKIGWEYGIRDKAVKKMAANILGIRYPRRSSFPTGRPTGSANRSSAMPPRTHGSAVKCTSSSLSPRSIP